MKAGGKITVIDTEGPSGVSSNPLPLTELPAWFQAHPGLAVYQVIGPNSNAAGLADPYHP